MRSRTRARVQPQVQPQPHVPNAVMVQPVPAQRPPPAGHAPGHGQERVAQGQQ